MSTHRMLLLRDTADDLDLLAKRLQGYVDAMHDANGTRSPWSPSERHEVTSAYREIWAATCDIKSDRLACARSSLWNAIGHLEAVIPEDRRSPGAHYLGQHATTIREARERIGRLSSAEVAS